VWATVVEDNADLLRRVAAPCRAADFNPPLVARGIRFLTSASSVDLLDVLGRNESERVATLTRLLRNSTEHELNELLSAFQQAIARLAEDRNAWEERIEQDAPGRS
jgi:hypothetical protein